MLHELNDFTVQSTDTNPQLLVSMVLLMII